MRQLPPPINGTEEYLRAIFERQGEVLEELKGLRVDLRPKDTVIEVGTIELKEPKPARSKASK